MKKNLLFAGIFVMILTVLLTAFAKPALANLASGTAAFDEMDAYIERQFELLNVPGGSLVVVEGDQIVHARGFGDTGIRGQVPGPQTPYFIGSLTKSFTALAVMQLVEEGKIELDAPLQRYLPWFTMADAKAASQITVRQLMIQTGGISQLPGMKGLANFDDAPDSSERQARALQSDNLVHPVGAKWEYSNANFNLLGLVIEAASGMSYADYIQQHIFDPLQMEHSYTDKATAQQNGLAVGHEQWFGFPVPVNKLKVPVASLASGQLISSAEDMGHYLIAQMNRGKYGETQVLSAQGTVQMHKPAVETGMVGSYGMGWFVNATKAGNLVFHYGEVPDGFAYMAFLPEKDRGIVLLVNTNHQVYTYALWATAESAALMLADVSPQPNSWGIMPWILHAVLLLPVLQGILIYADQRRLKAWLSGAHTLPGRTRLWLLYIIPQTLVNLLLAVIAVAFPASGLLKFIMLFMGDIASVLILCGTLALAWLVWRTLWVAKILRRSAAAR